MFSMIIAPQAKTLYLPQFPHEERKSYFARKAESLQQQQNASDLAEQLVDPLQRRIDFEEEVISDTEMSAASDVLLASTSQNQLVTGMAMGSGVVDAFQVSHTEHTLNQDRAEMGTFRHRLAEAQRKKIVYANDAKHLPIAWAASTTIGRGVLGFSSNTTIVARREQDFANIVLRRSDSTVSHPLLQNTFVVGTYAAQDVKFAGTPAERAIYEAHLSCFLGGTGQQLLVDYERFIGPGALLFRYAALGVVMGLAMQLPALLWAYLADKGSSSENNARTMFTVTAVAGIVVAAAGFMEGGLFAAARRRDSGHIRGVKKVINTHQYLLRMKKPAGSPAVVSKLREAAAYVGRYGYPIKQLDPKALVLKPISYAALEELDAFWEVLDPHTAAKMVETAAG